MERAQHGFSIATVVFVVTAFLLAPPPPAAAAVSKPGREVALDLRQNTVRIEARFGDQRENGFGFIVGEKEGNLFAVTAYHVVNPDDVTIEHPAKVKVWLYDHQGEPMDATLLGTHENDLAVITFPAPAGFQWDKKCFGRDDQRGQGTEVWFVGRGNEWTVPMSAGTISSDDPNDSQIDIEAFAVRPGSSGGPLIASSGVVGMVLADSANGTRALSIRFIQRKLNKWNYPFHLQSSAPPAEATAESSAPPDKVIAEKSVPPPRAEPPTPMSEGEAIAARNPLSAALRAQQPEGAGRRGFDLGMVSAKDQTLWGPGKQAMLDDLEGAEQEGFRAAAYFSVDHNAYVLLAETGAAIAEADPVVARVRMREQDAAFWLGFDIATGIFGDPKRGARGNTATGPNSLGIRDSLKSSASRRGFNASVALHLSRRY